MRVSHPISPVINYKKNVLTNVAIAGDVLARIGVYDNFYEKNQSASVACHKLLYYVQNISYHGFNRYIERNP